MSTSLRLDLRQSQQLVMTPQMQQAIKLLQMTNLELSAYVEEQIEQNPLLRREDDRPPEDAPAPEAGPAAPTAETAADTATRAGAAGEADLAAETFDTGAENLHDEARADRPPPSGAAGTGMGAGEEMPDLEARLAAGRTLRTHLIAQIGQMRAREPVTALARAIVEELDTDGYFRTGCTALAARLGAEACDLEEALALVQGCEPAGVAARSLAECYALQLAEMGGPDPEMRRLLDHLDLLGAGERARLCRRADLEPEILPQMVAELARLDPYPGGAFAPEPAETRVPDLVMHPVAGGGWDVELNPETLPRVLVDQTYAAAIRGGDTQTRSFLKRCREDASWLTRSLDQRARTILKVGAAIVAHQETFFRQGVTGLRPLSLARIAETVELHESTVSRVTAGKHIATPRGVLALKFFFTNAVGGAEGPSSDAVRARIARLIEAEPPDGVLSDDRLVALLGAEGIEVARRTVAKYRKALGLGSSAERRRHKALRRPV